MGLTLNQKTTRYKRVDLLDCVLDLENGPAEAVTTEHLEVWLLLFTHLRIQEDPAINQKPIAIDRLDMAGSNPAQPSQTFTLPYFIEYNAHTSIVRTLISQ